MHLLIHDIIEKSLVNGPGCRFVIWVQGCSKDCPDCFNPKAKNHDGGRLIAIKDIISRIVETEGIEGISVSGGEPFEQSEALFELLSIVKEVTQLTTIVFTGLSLKEIGRYAKLLPKIDQFVFNHILDIHQNCTVKNFICSTELPQNIEIHIQPDGSIKMTGFPNILIIERFKAALEGKPN